MTEVNGCVSMVTSSTHLIFFICADLDAYQVIRKSLPAYQVIRKYFTAYQVIRKSFTAHQEYPITF